MWDSSKTRFQSARGFSAEKGKLRDREAGNLWIYSLMFAGEFQTSVLFWWQSLHVHFYKVAVRPLLKCVCPFSNRIKKPKD